MARKSDPRAEFFEGLKEILGGPTVETVRSIAESAISEAQKLVADLGKEQKAIKTRLQTLQRRRAKKETQGLKKHAAAIERQIDALNRHRESTKRAEGTIRTRKNKPYGKALEHITAMLEHQGVEYACYLSMCTLWVSGFGAMQEVDAIHPPNIENPLELYTVRGMPLQGFNSATRRRLERFEVEYLRFLKETHQEFRRKGHPRADLADLFRLQIIEAERRLGAPRKKRPQSQRQERIRLALEKQLARNRGEQVPVDEEEHLRRKVYRRLQKELLEKYHVDLGGAWKAIEQNSS
jgi:hypothetical protein